MAGNSRVADAPIAMDNVISHGLDLLVPPVHLVVAVGPGSLGGFEKRIEQTIPHGLSPDGLVQTCGVGRGTSRPVVSYVPPFQGTAGEALVVLWQRCKLADH